MPESQNIIPKCCEEVQDKQTVFLRFDMEAICGVSESEGPQGQEGYKPKWKSAGWSERYQGWDVTEVKFCPHCATPVPEIKKRVTEEKICVVIDGGYYCNTCKKRLNECECCPPEYAWEIV
jgi:hypothetical protein